MKKAIISMFFVAVLMFVFPASTAFADYYSEGITLRQGMKSTEVVNLQNDLRSLGYFHFNSTGFFGDMTAQSVAQYQRANNLTADGIVGRRTARQIKVDKVLAMAKQFQGVPYVWGGTSPSGFDCSGYTHYVLLKNDIIAPRTAALQFNTGISVPKSQLQPGDLVFFTTYKAGPSHVGFYLGDGQFIHASSGAKRVTISNMNTAYYTQRYVGARRVIQ